MTAGSVLVPQVIPLRIPTPGKAKHEIDTKTLVEIKSDTPDVSIYYTIDGSKPQLFRGVGYRDHNTFKYKGPITLPDGKITVKALAVTKDCRESTIVTKVFVVEYVMPDEHAPDEDNDENFLKDLSGQMEEQNGLSGLKQRTKEVKAENKFIGAAQEFQGVSKEKKSLPSFPIGPRLLNNYFIASNDTKESISSTLMPQSQQMGIKGQTTVPMKTPTCIVCEAQIAPPLQPQASIHLQGKVLCVECGAGNPVHIKHCVICESRLPEVQMPAFRTEMPSTSLSPLRKTITCSKCGCINDWNIRICDWYDTKNSSSQTWQQSAASFPTSRPNSLGRNEQGTQTIGLFYPSSKSLEKKVCELVSQKKKQNKISDHSPVLTAISPGRGYWRKQLDHVCAHLRSYTQNNLEFRTLIGEPQMGTLISATVHKDDYEVSLQLNYALAINKDSLTNKPVTFHYHDVSLSNTPREGL
ncbi:double zinc ribbon and ankyrin repeat-containing protein 1 isoform X2 [Tiliqua scincoides]|uniref:double zinc ribbon and ankyrin repeat-containing protein 1 isoform X2 n=1 Tax=Tiliqua scincoides TaxID=71010 RepID=UPI003462AF2B